MNTLYLWLSLCLLYNAASALEGGRKILQQSSNTSSSLNIGLSGRGSVTGGSKNVATTTSNVSSVVVSRATTLFISGSNKLFQMPSSDPEYCPFAISAIYSEAEATVNAQVSAMASSNSFGSVDGNGFVDASGSASGSVRVEDYAEALVEGAVEAHVGVNRAEANGAVSAEIGVFAEAFASATSSISVDGNGFATALSETESRAAITATARVAINLIAKADCHGTEVFGDGSAESNVNTRETTSGGNSSSSASGTTSNSNAHGNGGASSGVIDGY